MGSRELILNRLNRASSPQYVSKQMLSSAQVSPGSVDLFIQQATAAGAQVVRVCDIAAAREHLQELIVIGSFQSIISSSDVVIGELDLPLLAAEMGRVYQDAVQLSPVEYREFVLRAQMGVSGCDYALADTGTIVISHQHTNERLISLAPNHYVCFVRAEQILADRFSMAAAFNQGLSAFPSAITLITGVSRTADVALQVVLGMHGPRRVDIIIIG